MLDDHDNDVRKSTRRPTLFARGRTGCVLLLGVLVLGASPASPGEPTAATRPLANTWTAVRDHGTHWQIASATSGSSTIEPVEITDAQERTRGGCPSGMVAVEGLMKTGRDDTVESLQSSVCLAWEPGSAPRRCLRFDAEAWASIASKLPVTPMRFCIDRFEYPNRRGAYPVIAVTWQETRDLCADQGKRMCTEDEWTFACEGEEALPYPYGYERDDTACVIDRPNPAFDEESLERREIPRFAHELDRLWRGEASGTRPRCRSISGVYDLTGNVDEWTASTRPYGRRSIMKGGYWGRIRARCRPSTRAHGETFFFYQQGFRCCSSTIAPARAG